MSEKWAEIEDYEGLYLVSDQGRIKSVDRYRNIYIRGASRKYPLKGKIKSIKLRGKYLHAMLCKNSVKNTYSVHTLVAKAFVPNPDNKPQVNHKDGDKLNNNAHNLEWVTAKENQHHAIEKGLSGVTTFDRFINAEKIEIIKFYRDKKYTQKSIGFILDVHPSTISKALKANGICWR